MAVAVAAPAREGRGAGCADGAGRAGPGRAAGWVVAALGGPPRREDPAVGVRGAGPKTPPQDVVARAHGVPECAQGARG